MRLFLYHCKIGRRGCKTLFLSVVYRVDLKQGFFSEKYTFQKLPNTPFESYLTISNIYTNRENYTSESFR